MKAKKIAETAVAPTGAVYAEYSTLPEGKGPKYFEIRVPYPQLTLWQRLKGWWG